ncbi:MAG: ATP-binding protein [Acidobacteriota bacterium]
MMKRPSFGVPPPPPVVPHRASPTRMRLLVLLPVTMGLLVAATGYFATSMSRRIHMLHGVFTTAAESQLRQLDIQLFIVALIAAVLAFGIAFGVTMPLRAFASRLEAVASGDLRGSLDVRATPEVESLAGAFNEALSSMNRYVFQTMTGAVITLDTHGKVIASSPAAEIVLGYREEEIVGQRFSDVFAPTDAGKATLAAFETAITHRKPMPVDEAYIATKEGRRIRVGLSVSYLRPAARSEDTPGSDDASSEVIGVTIGFKDLAEVRQLRENLRKADQLMALGTVTAGVAHELRNPLASMRGLTELLGRDIAREDPRSRYITTMIEAIDRLNHMVENLLLLSSDSTRAAEAIDVDALAREVVSFVKLGLGDRKVATRVVPDVSPAPVWTNGNRSRLIQALQNIVINAVQATPDGGVVSVSTQVSDPFVTVRVHNTGSYIAPDIMKRLFVPFFTTKPSGTGLGLAIARQIVDASDGRIDVESDQSTGTTFLVHLVAADGEGPAGRGEGQARSPLTNTA